MKEDLTTYDIKPEGFLNYLRYYGPHFNRKLCDFACENLDKKDYTKESLEQLFQQYNITIKNAKLHDCVYMANWCKAILYGSSIPDEKRLMMFLKDIFDKEGNLIFNRWYADMAKQGIPIEWEEMI